MHEGSLSLIAMRARADLLETLADMMEASPPLGDIEFTDAVHALIVAGVEHKEIARRFSVDIPTVERWSLSQSVPHKAARTPYAAHLVKTARFHANLLRAVCGRDLAEAA